MTDPQASQASPPTSDGSAPAPLIRTLTLQPPTPFAGPFGVSVSDRWIVVSDDLGHQVSLFTHDGRFVRAIGRHGSGAAEFAFLDAAVVDPASGRLVVADTGNNRIQILDIGPTDAGGDDDVRHVSSFGRGWVGGLSNPRDVMVTESGEIAVADFGGGRVRVFDRRGRPLRDIRGGGAIGGTPLLAPVQIARHAATGELFVSDAQRHEVIVFDARERFVRTIGSAPPGPAAPPRGNATSPADVAPTADAPGVLRSPHGLAFGPDGMLYVANTGRGRIEVFAPDGRFVRSVALPGTGAAGVTDVAFLPDGGMLVVDAAIHTVYVLR